MASSAHESSDLKVKLKTSDDEMFEVDKEVAFQSETLKHLFEDEVMTGRGIPLPNVSSKILAKVIEYCKYHVEVKKSSASGDKQPATEDEIKAWDQDFVRVDKSTLSDLVLAANYLSIHGLLDLTCKTVAEMTKNKTHEEIRQMFNIKNDYTPEEEEAILRENQWTFE